MLIAGLNEPEFIQDDTFKTIIYRPQTSTGQVSGEVKKVIMVLDGEMKRIEIMDVLALSHRENFILNYLNPALQKGPIEQTHPNNPRHRNQKYRLTKLGEELKKKLLAKD